MNTINKIRTSATEFEESTKTLESKHITPVARQVISKILGPFHCLTSKSDSIQSDVLESSIEETENTVTLKKYCNAESPKRS